MFFGKKEKEQNVDTAPSSASSSTKSEVKAKKKKSGMSTIFRESVLETVMSDFRDNEAFIHKENGEDKYVGIMLDTQKIGGLDKKSKRVEAKGQLIECINSGKIKTLITEDLLDEECIVFIPELLTLTAMDEFSMLTDATYELCYVEPNGDIELLGQEVTYKEITDILVDEGHIDDILGSEDENNEEEEPDALLDDNVGGDDVADLEDEAVSDLDDGDDLLESDDGIPVDDDEDIPMIDDDGQEIPNYQNSEPVNTYVPQQPTVDEQAANMQNAQNFEQNGEQMQNETENEIPQQWTEEAVVRKFYSDELGLEISINPFDAQFMQGNTFVPFDENRPSSWLNDNLNEMAKQANDEMNRMHSENLFLMRERYFRLISMHCDKIRKDLDINDPNTLYGQMKQQLDDDHVVGLQTIDAQVSAQKEALETQWKQRLQEIGMDAAREAQHKYRERYEPAHQQKVFDIENAVKANVDAEYKYGIHDLNERRRAEASSLLDLGISEVLDEISEMYTESLEAERVRYRELSENMREFQNDYLQADIARTNALQEELRQSEKADAVLAEQTAKIRSLTDEYAAKRRELQDDIEQMRADNKARLESMKHDCEKDIEKAMNDKDAIREQYNQLLEKYKTLDEKKDEEYKSRMNELHDELEAWSEKYDHIVDVHKKSNLMATFFVIAAIIASIAIGYIGGEFMNSNRNVKQQIQTMQQQQYDNSAANANANANADAEK